MIPVERWSGPSHPVEERQHTTALLRTLSPADYYAGFDWNVEAPGALDVLEHGLFPKLTLVASAGNAGVVADLLRRGADPLLCGQGDFTALHAAVQGGQVAVVACLLGASDKARALAASPCIGGLTPLMLAARPNVPVAVARLLVPHSDLEQRDAQGLRAEEHAVHFQRDDVLEALRGALES